MDLSDNDEAPPPPAPTSRRFVDFSTAQKEDVGMKVAKRTKKRGVVCGIIIIIIEALCVI